MKNLTPITKVFITTIAILGFLITGVYLSDTSWLNPWIVLVAVLATIAQLLKVEGAADKSTYNISWLIFGFTFVLMGAPSALVVILVAHIIEGIWLKVPWHIQIFNIASHTLALSTADLTRAWINPHNDLYSLASTLSLIAAIGTFTIINHVTVGLIIWLAQGQTIKQSGIFSGIPLMIDFTMIGLGAAAAILWTIFPSAVLLNLIPLYLIYRTLEMPSLKRRTELDPKINLYNMEYFAQSLEKELVRANRYHRPLTVVLADLDLLRNINNTYGHLAGDVVLRGVAEILQDQFPPPDVVARFGGEEFVILIPETTPEEALTRVEATREAIETVHFDVSTSVTPIQVTISFGISGRNGLNETFSAEELVHNADVALYQSKISGRNTIRIYTGEGIDSLFKINGDKKIPHLGLNDRLHNQTQVLQSKPKGSSWKAKSKQKTTSKSKTTKDKSDKKVNWMIALMSIFAFSLLLPIFHVDRATDWIGIAAFAAIVIIAEGFSFDIYVKDTSISTSAAPFIAGMLLFGPAAVPVLSFALAGTAMVKHRSPIKRFLFNFNNHLIAGTLCVWLIWFSPLPIDVHPVIVQIAFAMFSGIILFVSSTVLSAKVISLSMENSAFSLWAQHFRWLWPYYMAFGFTAYAFNLGYYYAGVPGIIALLVPLWMLRQSQSQHLRHTEGLVSQLRDNNKELEEQRDTIEALNEGLLLSLANAIDLRDPFTYGHSRNVSRYASLIAKEIGLKEEQINQISKASLLHDIGKLGIPEMILFKDGPLSNIERKIIQEHPELGAEIIRACPSMERLIPAILHHHERFDGTGYPDELAGEEIPFEARIIGLADAIEAMTSDRPYRRALNFEELMQELRKSSGKQFDPLAVKAFMRIAQKRGKSLIVNSGRIIASDNPATLEILSMYSRKIGGIHSTEPIDVTEYEMT